MRVKISEIDWDENGPNVNTMALKRNELEVSLTMSSVCYVGLPVDKKMKLQRKRIIKIVRHILAVIIENEELECSESITRNAIEFRLAGKSVETTSSLFTRYKNSLMRHNELSYEEGRRSALSVLLFIGGCLGGLLVKAILAGIFSEGTATWGALCILPFVCFAFFSLEFQSKKRREKIESQYSMS